MSRLIICFLLAAVGQVAADSFAGHYTLDRDAGDDPAEIAAHVTRNVGGLRARRMQARLEEVLTPSPTLEIRRAGDAYVIVREGGRSLRVIPGGPEMEQKTPDGDTARITAERDAGSLVIRIQAPRGKRVQILTPVEDGLRVVTTFNLGPLGETVHVTSLYRVTQASLEQAQPQPSPAQILMHADANEDGLIQYAEFRDLIPAARKDAQESIFTRVDTTGNGVLDVDELGYLIELQERAAEIAHANFIALDGDEDQHLNSSEFAQDSVLVAHGLTVPKAFREADQDDDGWLTRDEYTRLKAGIILSQPEMVGR
jgi:Ca2+-binding EF-hand superfamily protein